MTNQITVLPVAELQKMADVMSRSKLFGINDPTQALALMFLAQAQGKHPASIAQEYHIIQGRPALKADAMLARYFEAGGTVKWITLTDEKVEAEFTHPNSGTCTISWSLADAKSKKIAISPNWDKYPRAMLRSRVISEGIRTSYPNVIMGVYSEEEVRDFDNEPKVVHEENAEILSDTQEIDARALEIEDKNKTIAFSIVEKMTALKSKDELEDAMRAVAMKYGQSKIVMDIVTPA